MCVRTHLRLLDLILEHLDLILLSIPLPSDLYDLTSRCGCLCNGRVELLLGSFELTLQASDGLVQTVVAVLGSPEKISLVRRQHALSRRGKKG